MTKATDGAKGMAARLAQRAGLKHASSDQSTASSHDAKLTRSISDIPTKSKRIVGIGRSYERNTDELAITKKTNSSFECSANYWKEGLSLPESGKLLLHDSSMLFKGTHSELTFYYEDIAIDKTSKMGAFKITAVNHTAGGHTEYLFTTILKDRKLVFDTIRDAIHEAKTQPVIKKKKEEPFEMPLDEILSRMNSIGKERLKGVSMQDYYEVAWSEGNNCKKPPIYAPFLESCGKNNVVVSKWEEGQFTGDWCEQTYTHQRVITFNFMKQTIGQTLVEVKHTQQLIRYNDDRCIVHISMQMKGFPYADCFIVEVRHVASRFGARDLIIEVGMHVRFVKGCLFEGKIRNNTGSETSKAQLELLRRIVEGCAEYAVDVKDESDSEESEKAIYSEDVVASPAHCEAAPISRSAELSEAKNSALKTLLLVLTALFQKYVQPYTSNKYSEIQPTSVKKCLDDVRQRIVVLKDVCSVSVKEELREEALAEIDKIEESLKKIEQMEMFAQDK